MFESYCAVEAPEAAGPVWSACAPDGLLATVLDQQQGGDCAERLERVGAWEKVIAFAQAAQVREIAGFAAEVTTDPEFGDDPKQVYASVCAGVGAMTRLAARTAAARVDDALTLVERLPAVLSALGSGLISLSSARAIADETAGLDPALLGEAEAEILRHASGRTTGQIRGTARRVVAGLDADALRRRAERARRARCVRLASERDGMATLSAYLPAAEAVAIHGVLDDYARRAVRQGEDRSMDNRRADALVDLVLDRADGSGSRAEAQIHVTVSLTTLLGLDQLPAELAGYGPIPAEVAHQLAAEGTWRRLVTDPVSGQLLDYGTARYRPPPPLAGHAMVRDHTCGHPGCRVPAHRCDIDHHVPHNAREGTGPTSGGNIGPLCRSHHRLKHSPGWSVTRDPDGRLTWRSPTGHRFTRYPPRLSYPQGGSDPGSELHEVGFPDAEFPDAEFLNVRFSDVGFPDDGFPDDRFLDSVLSDVGCLNADPDDVPNQAAATVECTSPTL